MDRDLVKEMTKMLLVINAVRNGWVIKVKNHNEYQFIKPKNKVRCDYSVEEFINNLLGKGAK
jgi:hypothetical protein